MLSAQRFLNEVIASLRNVIAPAISEPYPKTQAYMAALILEFVARQVEERGDIASAKAEALESLLRDISRMAGASAADHGDDDPEARLCGIIERLYAERDRIGEAEFRALNDRIRRGLRELLNQDLRVAGGKGE
jgi:hypothetical protein